MHDLERVPESPSHSMDKKFGVVTESKHQPSAVAAAVPPGAPSAEVSVASALAPADDSAAISARTAPATAAIAVALTLATADTRSLQAQQPQPSPGSRRTKRLMSFKSTGQSSASSAKQQSQQPKSAQTAAVQRVAFVSTSLLLAAVIVLIFRAAKGETVTAQTHIATWFALHTIEVALASSIIRTFYARAEMSAPDGTAGATAAGSRYQHTNSPLDSPKTGAGRRLRVAVEQPAGAGGQSVAGSNLGSPQRVSRNPF